MQGFRTLRLESAGVSLSVPDSWPVTLQRAPLVAVVGSGSAVISVWRYPRSTSPPASERQLAAARASLFESVRGRQGSVRVIGSRLARIDGRPAIEFDALETIAGVPRRVLSTHVFADAGEVVLEEYAPPGQFASLRYPVFARVRHSLTLIGAGA